ncbi:MAG: MBL fold metallo-hydrolase [Deltaproteobacteria bacterium]|nr:MBL fold metallo-hydrolase [Deltaproteobacteria bacterium]
MFLEKVVSEGISHLSYIIGHGGKAAVIDPRCDCRIYIDIAARNGAEITHILETHRNEDYVIGSKVLSELTGANIYHGKAFDFDYGTPVSEGNRFELGDLELSVIETPGHTLESISIAVRDKGFSNDPIGVFTGDALFIGNVGRTDFYPDRPEAMAGMLFDSIFGKLLPLGDHVLLFPAHGSGSICGSGMAAREFSTLGYERINNPVLQNKERQKFVDYKVAENHYLPPYFKQMEKLNKEGATPHFENLKSLKAYRADAFESASKEGMKVLDIRSPEALAGAFIEGSLAIPLNMVPAYAGWFLNYSRDIGIISENVGDAITASRYLFRLGYDCVKGYLVNGLTGWETSGRQYSRINAVHVKELVKRIQEKEAFTLLDVRTKEEVQRGRLPGTLHIYLGHLPNELEKISKDQPVTAFCGSGLRAIIAASILKQNGFKQVEVSLGSMEACAALGCPLEI